MKTLVFSALLFSAAFGALGQGTVVFHNALSELVVTHVYTTPDLFTRHGNSQDDTPPGSADYLGCTLLSGSGWYATLLAAPGANAPESSLVAAEGVTTFRTGSAAGHVEPIELTLKGVPKDAPWATLQMVVWDNRSGNYPTWAAAEAAWEAGILSCGKSPVFGLSDIGGDIHPPATLFGLRSFAFPIIPEPCTATLVSLGAVVLLVGNATRRRFRARSGVHQASELEAARGARDRFFWTSVFS